MLLAGLTVGDPVLKTGKPLSAELGPGKLDEITLLNTTLFFKGFVQTFLMESKDLLRKSKLYQKLFIFHVESTLPH